MLRFRNLGSGSSGNATVVEARDGLQVTRILVDCGLGPTQIARRLGEAGLDIRQIDALFVTHEHSDHVGCAVTLSLRHQRPLWMSRGTYEAIGQPPLGDLLKVARSQQPIEIGAMRLEPVAVPHDAAEPLQLRCTDGDRRLGILTDIGHATPAVTEHFALCHALLLETNHDEDLLAASSYPVFLKRRIAGPRGHLSNAQSAQIACIVNHAGLGTVVAAHLSERNNRPDLARQALGQALGRTPGDIEAAHPTAGTVWLPV